MTVRKMEINVGPQFTQARVMAESINEDERSVVCDFVTENEVMVYNWDYGRVKEILLCDDAHGDLSRLNSIGVLLDTHNKSSVEKVHGRIEKAWFENGKGRAKIVFSKVGAADESWQKVKEGTIRSISVGYMVSEYEITDNKDSVYPTARATKWMATEISLAPVPADPDAQIRSAQANPHKISINLKSNTMTEQEKRKQQIEDICRALDLSDNFANGLNANEELNIEQARSLAQAEFKKLNTPAPAPASQRTAAEEKARVTTIASLCRKAGVEQSVIDGYIKDDKTVDQVRELLIDKLLENSNQSNLSGLHGGIKVTADATDKRRSGMENAIMARVGHVSVDGKKPEPGEYRGMTLLRMAEECLSEIGISVRGMTQREIAQLALNLDGMGRMHSSSDFPLILANTVNKVLRAQYALQESTFGVWSRRSTATDFKEMARLQIGDLKFGDVIKEGGEYKQVTLGEGREKYSVAKYGALVLLTWEMLVNDDLNAFDRVPQSIAAAAKQKQSDIMYAVLTGTHLMSDGQTLFHSSHKNLASSSAAITESAIAAARAAMRKQTSLAGNALNIAPKFLIVGPDKEHEALKITSANYVPVQSNDQNIFGRLLTPVVDARISGNAWFLAASPSAIDTVEYAFLDGEELYTEQRTGFDVDGLEIKARMVFGAKAIDYRGLYKNPGA